MMKLWSCVLELCLVMYVECACVVGADGRRREMILRGIPAPLAQSALWDQSVRDSVTNNKISEQVLQPSYFYRSYVL